MPFSPALVQLVAALAAGASLRAGDVAAAAATGATGQDRAPVILAARETLPAGDRPPSEGLPARDAASLPVIAPPAPTPEQIALAEANAAAAPPAPVPAAPVEIASAATPPPAPIPTPPAETTSTAAAAPPPAPIPASPVEVASAAAAPPPPSPVPAAPVEIASAAAAAPPTPPAPAPAPEAFAQAGAPPPDAPLPPPPLVEDPNNPEAPPPALGEDADQAVLDGRRRPGVGRPLPERVTQDNPGAVHAPPPEAFPSAQFPIPDRWRLIQSLGIVKENLLDPYHQSTLKGDRPLCKATPEEQERREHEKLPKCITPRFLKGEDWFLSLSATSDTVVEPRTFPIPSGIQFPTRPGQNDVFGKNTSFAFSQTFITSASLIKGDTAYMPPEIEYRLTLAWNVNYAHVPERRVLFVDPTRGTSRTDTFLGVQEAFIDYHIANTSDRYDFYSLRAGIQPINLDFRGFLFNDQTLAVRLFGNRDNNRFQFNVAGIWRIEKDTNSGLNDLSQPLRRDWILAANLYRQDFPLPGLTSELLGAWNINREGKEDYIDHNGFPVRPALLGNLNGRNYDAFYLGYAAEGRFGRANLSFQAYGVFGSDRHNVFTGRTGRIRGFFAAAEPSYDLDWIRIRGALLWQSGDHDAFDNTETGFDAIQENPLFAGADTSYWIRQAVPFIGGGRQITLTGRNGLLIDLRSSKDEGQSNFINPGERLIGIGADFDLLPQLRLSTNLNHLWFDTTSVLKTLRSEGSIPRDIGWDLSAAAVYRPKQNQNLVFRLSGAFLLPGSGFRDLFENRDRTRYYYSILFNAILNY